METRRAVSTRNRPNKEKTAPVPAKRTRRAVSMENQTEVVSLPAKRTRRAISVENPATEVVLSPAKRTRRIESIENESKQSTEVIYGPSKRKPQEWTELSKSITIHSELFEKCLELNQNLHEEKNSLISLQQSYIEMSEECAVKEKQIEHLKHTSQDFKKSATRT